MRLYGGRDRINHRSYGTLFSETLFCSRCLARNHLRNANPRVCAAPQVWHPSAMKTFQSFGERTLVSVPLVQSVCGKRLTSTNFHIHGLDARCHLELQCTERNVFLDAEGHRACQWSAEKESGYISYLVHHFPSSSGIFRAKKHVQLWWLRCSHLHLFCHPPVLLCRWQPGVRFCGPRNLHHLHHQRPEGWTGQGASWSQRGAVSNVSWCWKILKQYLKKLRYVIDVELLPFLSSEVSWFLILLCFLHFWQFFAVRRCFYNQTAAPS